MGITNMQGTSAFIEQVAPKGMRRTKCKYYEKKRCNNKKTWKFHYGKCVGAWICGCFKYDDNKEKNKNQNKRNVVKKEEKQELKTEELVYKNRVKVGSSVKLFDYGYSEKLKFKLVEKGCGNGIDKIAIDSPLGQAIFNKRVQDIIIMEINGVKNKFRIENIEN